MNRKNQYKNLDKWREARNRSRKKNYGKTAYAPNYKKAWTTKEIEVVMKHEVTDFEISQLIGRSVASIQQKRYQLNKVISYEAY